MKGITGAISPQYFAASDEYSEYFLNIQMNTHIHTHINGPLSGTTGWASTRKEKPIWILLKQELGHIAVRAVWPLRYQRHCTELVRVLPQWPDSVIRPHRSHHSIFSSHVQCTPGVRVWTLGFHCLHWRPHSRVRQAQRPLSHVRGRHTALRQQLTRRRRVCARPTDQLYLWSRQEVRVAPTAAERRQNWDDLVWFAFQFGQTATHQPDLRAGVLTCGSCHLERSARQHPHRGWSCQVPKTA